MERRPLWVRSAWAAVAIVAGGVAARGAVPGAPITRESVNSAGEPGNAYSTSPALSGTGRFLAFVSQADNLVEGDTNGGADIFLRDLKRGVTTRVSVSTAGGQVNSSSSDPSVTPNGRFVAFWSHAADLVPDDGNGQPDVFVRDVKRGTTTRVSVNSAGVEADGESAIAAISDNGRFVAFESYAGNLVPGDANGTLDVFVRDLRTGKTVRASADLAGGDANSDCYDATISADGRFVAFQSNADDLVEGDTNGASDVFVRDLKRGTTTRVSVDSAGAQGNGTSYEAAISANGRTVTFVSNAVNLTPNDVNMGPDVFVHDLRTGATTRVSVGPTGAGPNGGVSNPAVSRDGRVVAFVSTADNLAEGASNGAAHVFVRDLRRATTTRASASADGTAGNSQSFSPSLAANGRMVAFTSIADNLVPDDRNSADDVFVRRIP